MCTSPNLLSFRSCVLLQVLFHAASSKLITASADGLVAVHDVAGGLEQDDGFIAALNVGTSVEQLGLYGSEGQHMWCRWVQVVLLIGVEPGCGGGSRDRPGSARQVGTVGVVQAGGLCVQPERGNPGCDVLTVGMLFSWRTWRVACLQVQPRCAAVQQLPACICMCAGDVMSLHCNTHAHGRFFH